MKTIGAAPRLTFVTLGVQDMERSRHFYRDILGWPEKGGDGFCSYQLGTVRLAHYPAHLLAEDGGVTGPLAPLPAFPGFALAHNVHSSEAVDELLSAVVAAGATLARPARATDWGGYSGYFRDPDGFLWEVAWNPHLKLD